MADALEIRYFPTCVTIPNFVPVGQDVLALVDAEAPRPWAWLTP